MGVIKTVAVIVGTRPEAIKLAPVIRELRAGEGIRCVVCATGQHAELAHEVLEDFGIVTDVDLGAMRPGQSLAELTSRLLDGLDQFYEREAPAFVVVQGDTTSALVGALAAFYKKIPVGHVEAGLRTGDMTAPWPEEANRRLIAPLAALHFAPTEGARDNLLREGIDAGRIAVTGNTAIDALLWMRDRVRREPPRPLPAGRIVLVTAHRREHFGARFDEVCRAVGELAARFAEVQFVFPVHPNPEVRASLARVFGERRDVLTLYPNIMLEKPLRYSECVQVMDRCELILTDSGGIQEEAPSLGKPVLVLRDKTERPEGVEAGVARVVGTERGRIVSEAAAVLEGRGVGWRTDCACSPFGDGRAAARIAGRVADWLGVTARDFSNS